MAILSNINGKFAVDSSGGIQFSGQTGTSGYVLKSNGNAAPTWVDGSTVIGGPYLPLSGGTLTGATATASGISLTVGGALTVNGKTTFNIDGDSTFFIEDGGTNAVYMRAAASDEIYFGANNNWQMRFQTTGNVTMDNGGSFGIGTATPTEKLQIVQGEQAMIGDYFMLGSGNANYMGTLGFNRNTTNGVIYNSSYGAFQFHNNNGTLCLQGYAAGGGNEFEHLFFNSGQVFFDGSVGIGTTTPGTKLDVRGTGYFLSTAASGAALVTIENNSGSTATSYGLLVIGGGNSSNGRTFEVRDASGDVDLIVKGNGNVGIGTASPSVNLEIFKSSGPALLLTAGGSGTAGFKITKGDSGTAYINNVDNVEMQFQIANGTYMTIASGGNILIGTTSSAGKLNVGGKIFAAQNNSSITLMRTIRVLNIPHGSNAGNFTFDFDPIAIWGFSVTGGHVEINAAGWSQRVNAGIIQFQNNGGSAPLTVAIFVQTAVNGSGTISVQALNPGVNNTLRVTFANWHSNAHAWNAWITSPKS